MTYTDADTHTDTRSKRADGGAGLDADTLLVLRRMPHVLYISCNPVSAAANVVTLLPTHELARVAVFDQVHLGPPTVAAAVHFSPLSPSPRVCCAHRTLRARPHARTSPCQAGSHAEGAHTRLTGLAAPVSFRTRLIWNAAFGCVPATPARSPRPPPPRSSTPLPQPQP